LSGQSGSNGLFVNPRFWEIGRRSKSESDLVNSCCKLPFKFQGSNSSWRHGTTQVVLPESKRARLLVISSESAPKAPEDSGVNRRRTNKIQSLSAELLLAQDMPFENYLRQYSL